MVEAAMQRQVRNLGRPGLCTMAISAVDIALWDLRAKLLGLSLADSLGRFQEAIPAYGSGGFTSYTDAELAAQLRGWVERGCRRVKIKVGREPERDPARRAVAREAIGESVELMVDANGAFDRRAADGLRWLRDVVPAGMEVAAGEYAWHFVPSPGGAQQRSERWVMRPSSRGSVGTLASPTRLRGFHRAQPDVCGSGISKLSSVPCPRLLRS